MRKALGLALCLGLLGPSLAGCSVRLDVPPAALPELSQEQALRSQLSLELQSLSLGAQNLSQAGGENAELLGAQSRELAAQLELLGGVWNPWPEGLPRGGQPAPSAPPPPQNLEEYRQRLAALPQLSAQDLSLQLQSSEASQAAGGLLGMLWVVQGLELQDLGQPAPTVQGQIQSPGDAAPGTLELSRGQREAFAKYAAAFDLARFNLEGAAGQFSGPERELALKGAEMAAVWSDDLAKLSGVEARRGVYLQPAPADLESARRLHRQSLEEMLRLNLLCLQEGVEPLIPLFLERSASCARMLHLLGYSPEQLLQSADLADPKTAEQG